MVATTSKKKSAPSIKIELIPISDCINHEDNLDEFSSKYGAKVNESKVENLISLIREYGYDASRPALLRPVVINGRIIKQVVVGNHRLCALRALFAEEGNPDYEYIPAEVRDMSEEEAYMKLLTDQSREITAMHKARHAHTFIQRYCKDDTGNKVSVSYYALKAGICASTATQYTQAVDVTDYLKELGSPVSSVSLATEISKLDREDWKWFADLCQSYNINSTKVREVVKQVKSVNIPDRFQEWLPTLFWKREIANQAMISYSLESDAARDLPAWIGTATILMDKLESNGAVTKWKFSKGEPQAELVNVAEAFLGMLVSDLKIPTSIDDIKKIAQVVMGGITKAKVDYENWKKQKADQIEKERLAAEAQANQALERPSEDIKPSIKQPTTSTYDPALQQYEDTETTEVIEELEKELSKDLMFSPEGLIGTVNDLSQCYLNEFKLAIAELPAKILNDDTMLDQWMLAASKIITDDGCVVAICDDTDSVESLKFSAKAAGLSIADVLVLVGAGKHCNVLRASSRYRFAVVAANSGYLDLITDNEQLDNMPVDEFLIRVYSYGGKVLDAHATSNKYVAIARSHQIESAYLCPTKKERDRIAVSLNI